MKLTKCDNKHFYDADKYSDCPHCAKISETAQAASSVPKMEKPGMGLSSLPKEKAVPLSTLTDSIWEQNADSKTIGVMEQFDTPAKSNDKDIAQEIAVSGESTNRPMPQESLQSQIKAVSAHSPAEDTKTVAFYDFADVQPVVGWLVCVKGEYFGQSFNLKAGQNFVGRALNMDVPLAKDVSISRNKHAIITHDPQNNVFFIQPGESSGLTYLNGDLLLTYQSLKIYDKISLGSSAFVFIPCCGERFTWEDYTQ